MARPHIKKRPTGRKYFEIPVHLSHIPTGVNFVPDVYRLTDGKLFPKT